ncbi:MAG: carboxypeptidase-like regulatory domain-containing protein [bacterium]
MKKTIFIITILIIFVCFFGGNISNIKALTTTCHVSSSWAWDYCFVGCECDAGEGDCDSDSQCKTGYCALDVGANYGQGYWTDVCEEKSDTQVSGGVIFGTVKDENGNPVVDATVETVLCPGTICTSCGKEQTDTNGNYRMTGLTTGFYVIKASKAGYTLSNSSGSSCHSNYVEKYGKGIICIGLGDGSCGKTTIEKTSDFTFLKQGSLILTSPNGEEWLKTGNSHDITWQSEDVDKVNIELTKGSENWHLAYDVLASTGKFNWKIGNYIPDSYYRINILDARNSSVSDGSDDYFTLVTEGISVCTDSDSGADYYKKGSTTGLQETTLSADEPITKSDYCVGDESINGLPGSVMEYWCEKGIYINGSLYDCLYGCKNGACSKEEKSIIVSSPNGEESWLSGETYPIEWSYAGTTTNVNVIIQISYKNLDSTYRLEDVIVSNLSHIETYNWTVPITVTSGRQLDQYLIKITYVYPDGSSVEDYSDGVFSIEKAPCHASSLFAWDYCSATCPCDVGEGDCDINADCSTGYCAQDAGANYGQSATMDVCVIGEDETIDTEEMDGIEEELLGSMKNQLASIVEMISQLMEKIRTLSGK